MFIWWSMILHVLQAERKITIIEKKNRRESLRDGVRRARRRVRASFVERKAIGKIITLNS